MPVGQALGTDRLSASVSIIRCRDACVVVGGIELKLFIRPALPLRGVQARLGYDQAIKGPLLHVDV